MLDDTDPYGLNHAESVIQDNLAALNESPPPPEVSLTLAGLANMSLAHVKAGKYSDQELIADLYLILATAYQLGTRTG